MSGTISENAKNISTKDPISMAKSDGNLEILRWLLFDYSHKGESKPVYVSNGSYLYHFDLSSPMIYAINDENIEVIEWLIKKNIDVNHRYEDNFTAIMFAALARKIDTVKFLFYAGADINATDKNGITPLMYAVKNGNKDIVKFLINAGADINAADKNGITPLMYAVKNGNKDTVEFLTDAGADINAKDKDGNTALNHAIENKNVEIIREILKYDSDIRSLEEHHTYLISGYENILEGLVINEEQINPIIYTNSFQGETELKPQLEIDEFKHELRSKMCIVRQIEGSEDLIIVNYQDITQLFDSHGEKYEKEFGKEEPGNGGRGIALFFAKCKKQGIRLFDGDRKEITHYTKQDKDTKSDKEDVTPFDDNDNEIENQSAKIMTVHSLTTLAASAFKKSIKPKDIQGEKYNKSREILDKTPISKDGKSDKWTGGVLASFGQKDDAEIQI
ncbi:ankyrin repeat domain-containing protein [Rickettsiales bacterium]|nr:ankyrin repeat domain-containing protein [Rickettsiales bacterium]